MAVGSMVLGRAVLLVLLFSLWEWKKCPAFAILRSEPVGLSCFGVWFELAWTVHIAILLALEGIFGVFVFFLMLMRFTYLKNSLALSSSPRLFLHPLFLKMSFFDFIQVNDPLLGIFLFYKRHSKAPFLLDATFSSTPDTITR